MAKRIVKAKYKVEPCGEITRAVVSCHMDETKSLQKERKLITEEMFMVYFPPKAKGTPGHSIRVNKAELIRLGFHKKPRLIDMETGDVVDVGGDPYDFATESLEDDYDINLLDEDVDVDPSVTTVDLEASAPKRVKASEKEKVET